MKVIIFGATGRVGRELVKEALAEGNSVTGFVRPGENLINPGFNIARGDLLNTNDVNQAIAGQEAVLYAVGVVKNGPPDIVSHGLENVIAAMKNNNVRRVVAVSAYGAGETHKGFFIKILWLFGQSMMADKEVAEEKLKSSGLDFVAVRPVFMVDGPKTGSYQTGHGLMVGGIRPKISRSDLAEFMVKELVDNTFLGKNPTISY